MARCGRLTVSLRRQYVDQFFTDVLARLTPPGPVLDLGGYRRDQRGAFRCPATLVVNLAADHPVDVVADGSALPCRRETFAMVTCSEVLEHVPDPHRVLAEIRRVLQREGLLVATVPFLHPIHGSTDYGRYTDRYWREACATAGLTVRLLIWQGSLGSVLVDLVRAAALSRFGTQSFRHRLIRAVLRWTVFAWAMPLAVWGDARLLARAPALAHAFPGGFGFVAVQTA